MVVLDTINNKFTDHPQILMYCVSCGKQFVLYGNCGHRSCGLCRHKAYLRLYHGYKWLVDREKPNLLITLTRKNSMTLDREYVNSIRKAFAKMLRLVYFKRNLTGGIYAIECIEKGKGWNLHLHLIGIGNNMFSSKISAYLLRYTGDSFCCDVEVIRDHDYTFKYILKDLLKPPNLNGKSKEYDDTFRGIRIVSKFGSWYNEPIHDDKKCTCPDCGQDDVYSEYFFDQQIRKMHAQ